MANCHNISCEYPPTEYPPTEYPPTKYPPTEYLYLYNFDITLKLFYRKYLQMKKKQQLIIDKS